MTSNDVDAREYSSGEPMERETVRLPPGLVAHARRLVATGRYPNRSEFYREAIREHADWGETDG